MIGLKSALSCIRRLENTLKRKEIGLESVLSGIRGLEDTLKKERDTARKHIILWVRARKNNQKKWIRLKNTLFDKRGLENALSDM